MKNIVVLVSGGGTNLQALIDAGKKGMLGNGKITCVIASKADAYALTRAENNGIKTIIVVNAEPILLNKTASVPSFTVPPKSIFFRTLSITTIVLSTTMPIPSAIPDTERIFILLPLICKIKIVNKILFHISFIDHAFFNVCNIKSPQPFRLKPRFSERQMRNKH